VVLGRALESTEPKVTSGTTPPQRAKPKRKGKRVIVIIAVLVIVISVLAVIFSSLNGSTPKPTFAIVYHNATIESNTTTSFNVTISFRVNNTGSVTGNVTVIFKVFCGGYTWGGAQIFNDVEPGQSLYSYKEHIPVLGDPESDWTYQCFVNGQKAIKYPHEG
jgi:hypothetical protein